MVINRDIFEDLFVLEMANNHWGRVERGLRIVDDYAQVVRYNNVRAAIKFQFRDVETFIHPDHADRNDVRYIKKTMDTWMSQRRLRATRVAHPAVRVHPDGDAVRRGRPSTCASSSACRS